MQISELILSQPVSPPAFLHKAQNTDRLSKSQMQTKEVAKEFEAILLNKLMEKMNSTVGDVGGDKKAASKQIDGLFSFYLSRHLAKNGGLGIWKDVYQFFNDIENAPPQKNSIEGSA